MFRYFKKRESKRIYNNGTNVVSSLVTIFFLPLQLYFNMDLVYIVES